nr:hypothetical protein [Candidatus Enterovibrio luxaltus]
MKYYLICLNRPAEESNVILGDGAYGTRQCYEPLCIKKAISPPCQGKK